MTEHGFNRELRIGPIISTRNMATMAGGQIKRHHEAAQISFMAARRVSKGTDL